VLHSVSSSPTSKCLQRVTVRGIHSDKDCRGHNHPDGFQVCIGGQARHATKVVRREMRRRAAVESLIGHLKDDHRLGRQLSQGPRGEASTRFHRWRQTSAHSCAACYTPLG
jgi:hypothetical protein